MDDGDKGEEWETEGMGDVVLVSSTWVRNIGESKQTQGTSKGGDAALCLEMYSLMCLGHGQEMLRMLC